MSMSIDSSRRLHRVFSFDTFPHPDDASALGGPFRTNIVRFLGECGEILDQIHGMSVWRIRLLDINNIDVSLYVFQQPTNECCGYCCQSGWSHHYITKMRYHLIIPREDNNKPLDSSIFNSESNILYGFIHCNGFGHLICINAREVMDLWDRVCTHLHTRAITVQDPCWKRELPVWFLYEIAYGCPWFARWGYKFCKGSFGISESDYTEAMNMVRSIQLKDHPFQESDALAIICWYKTLDSSLRNLADLFKLMLSLKPPHRQKDGGVVDIIALTAGKRRPRVLGDDIVSDLDCLYNELRFCMNSKVVRLAVKTIVETKIFVKEWPYVPKSGVLLRLSCLVRPDSEELEKKHFTRGFPPGEHIVLYEYCTVGELKIYAQCGMRDTYHVMDRISITELEGEAELDGAGRRDSIVFSGGECLLSGLTVGQEFQLRFKAIDFAFENENVYNGGKDRVVVKCKCGATDFDGERMTECEECKIWQHSRCSGIDISKGHSACITCKFKLQD